MTIRQPVINTFNRVGIDYKTLQNPNEYMQDTEVSNWITGETVKTTPLIRECVIWVYNTQLDYEKGYGKVKLSDFDRVRYFIAKADSKVYSACID